MGDTEQSPSVPPVEEVFVEGFVYNDWNSLYEIIAKKYFDGEKTWPCWEILSRKRKIARPSWYRVEEPVEVESEDEETDEEESVPPLPVVVTKKKQQQQQQQQQKKKKKPSPTRRRTQQTSSRPTPEKAKAKSTTPKKRATRNSSDSAHRSRSTPSRKSAQNVLSYADFEGDDVTDEEDLIVTSPPAPVVKRARVAETSNQKQTTRGPTTINSKSSPQGNLVTMQSSTEDTYMLHFPTSPDGLGLSLYKEGMSARFNLLQRPFDFGDHPPPQRGDTMLSIDGKAVGKISFQEITAQLAQNPGTRSCTIGFERSNDTTETLAVTMEAVESDTHDYLLRFPPSPNGVGVSLYKEGDMTCFFQLMRPIDFGNCPPPQEGDSVETIDDQFVGKMGYAGIVKILAENSGKSVCRIGLKRRHTEGAARELPSAEAPPVEPKAPGTKSHSEVLGTTKAVDQDEYDFYLPVTKKGLGIRVRSEGNFVCLDHMHRKLDAASQVQPQLGDFITMIDGMSVLSTSYHDIVNELRNSNNRRKRIIRLKKKDAFLKANPEAGQVIGGNGTLNPAAAAADNGGHLPVQTSVAVLSPPMVNITVADTKVPSVQTMPPIQNLGVLGGAPMLDSAPMGEASTVPPEGCFDFDITILKTERGLGIYLYQIGGKAHFDRFHDFAQVHCHQTILPEKGDEIIAVDMVPVDGASYVKVIELLKKDNGPYRALRLRRNPKKSNARP